jgi:hypothetical protein
MRRVLVMTAAGARTVWGEASSSPVVSPLLTSTRGRACSPQVDRTGILAPRSTVARIRTTIQIQPE